MTRQLSDEAVLHQAEALAEFVRRGGSASRWFASKEFTPADRRAVLVAYGDLVDGPERAA